MMFKACCGPLPIYLRWYEFPLGTCRSGGLGVVPSCEQQDARNTIRTYEDTQYEDAREFGDLYVRAPTQQELKIAERVTA